MKKIYFATDHAGYELKEALMPLVRDELGYEAEDMGAYELDAQDDYPDFIHKAARAVSEGSEYTRAIILGGSGQGEAMVANRYSGVRAAVYNCDNLELIRLSREHNNANVLSLGARFISNEEAKRAVRQWLETKYIPVDRHERRIKKIDII